MYTEDWRAALNMSHSTGSSSPLMQMCKELQETIEPADTTGTASIFFFIFHRLHGRSDRAALSGNLHLICSVTLHFVIDFHYRGTLHLLSPFTFAF